MSSVSAVEVRNLVVAGNREAAARALWEPVAALAGQEVREVRITSDEYSLNSVSGLVDLADGSTCFFKFHAEDGEGDNVGEYYRAHVLADAGLPVDLPLAVSSTAGHQLVLYRVRRDRRMVDVCRGLERQQGDSARLPDALASARRQLDAVIGQVAARSLREASADEGERAAIHQLFNHRMRETDGRYPGGRLERWYTSRPEWSTLSQRLWRINGVEYAATLATLVECAYVDTAPSRLGRGPLVTAHGDDHHGNVWVEERQAGTSLALFDPAFAGDDLPALLALVKPTFHNVFAHPAWLYHPGEVEGGRVTVVDDGTTVHVDAPPLSPLRLEVLDSIVEQAWIPLLRALVERDALDPAWRQTVRSALMLCPLLVTDLMADDRSPDTQMLGLAHVVMMGSEPVAGTDALSRALDRMQEAVSDR